MYQFSRLFQEYYPKFVRYANSYLEDNAAAEDIVMDSFMYCWENKESLSPINNIPAYLLTVIKNKCLNVLRAKKIQLKAKDKINDYNLRILEVSITTLEACDPIELFSEEVRQMVDDAITSLPDRTKEIFIKSRFQNKSYREIAEEMQLSTKAVEKHISKALKILRISLKDYFPALIFLLFFK